MKYYYAIKTVDNERSSSYKYITDTLEDAQAHRMGFCGWYCQRGDVTIHKLDQYFNVVEEIDYWCGQIWTHKVMDKVSMHYLVKDGKPVKKNKRS